MLNVANRYSTTLASAMLSTDTSLIVVSAIGSPEAPFLLSVENEIVKVTAKNGTTFTVERSQEDTIAVPHSIGTIVANYWTAGTYKQLIKLENDIVNANCQVAQGDSEDLSTIYQVGEVDMFAVKASGDVITSGTITQSAFGGTRFGKGIAITGGTTISGDGKVYCSYRIESKTASKYKDRKGSFGLKVYHNVGNNITYDICIKKASTEDNFSITSIIDTKTGILVPNAVVTNIDFENIDMGDCSNGIEIEIIANCSTVSGKLFMWSEWEAVQNEFLTDVIVKSYAEELEQCTWHDEVFSKGSDIREYLGIGECNTTSTVRVVFQYKKKRVIPTITIEGAVTNISTRYKNLARFIDSAIIGSGITVDRALLEVTDNSAPFTIGHACLVALEGTAKIRIYAGLF